jgi:hypothetical protein
VAESRSSNAKVFVRRYVPAASHIVTGPVAFFPARAARTASRALSKVANGFSRVPFAASLPEVETWNSSVWAFTAVTAPNTRQLMAFRTIIFITSV